MNGVNKIAAIALCALSISASPAVGEPLDHADFDRVFAVTTFEHRVLRAQDSTPYPDTLDRFEALFALGGYRMEPPNDDGEWYARTYLWAPSTLMMQAGETVLLEFFGINGERHPSIIKDPKGNTIAEFEVGRGEITQLPFTAETPGIYEFVSVNRLPGMVGQIVVMGN